MASFSHIDLARLAALIASADTPVLSPALTLAQSGALAVQWAPFDHTPPTARLVIVGITPGREQAQNALRAFRTALLKGLAWPEALREAKLTGSFSGPMRSSLVAMLDRIEVNRLLSVTSSDELFDPAHELVHFTSALRYPVFVSGANYNGTPDMLRTPMLREMIDGCLASEARLLPDALWLPLGPRPTAAIRYLIAQGALRANQVLEGLPHPSGANAERISYFLGRKARALLSSKTHPDKLDQARTALIAQVGQLLQAGGAR